MGATLTINCPCLQREKVELYRPLIPSNASGGEQGYGWCVAQNQRTRMEDAVDVELREDHKLFAVYDGHGGTGAVEYLKQELPKIVNAGEIEANLQEGYEKLDERLRKHVNNMEKSPTKTLSSGVVACVAVCQEKKVVIANLGDCRALKCSKGAIQVLTTDHRPDEPAESERLASLGLRAEDGYLCEGLAVSRAFGDFNLETGEKCAGLICKPDVSVVDVDEDTEFILLASDGVFEHMDSREVGLSTRRILRRTQCAKQTAERLVDQAIKLGSSDNISAILISFKMPSAENTNSALRRKVVLDGL